MVMITKLLSTFIIFVFSHSNDMEVTKGIQLVFTTLTYCSLVDPATAGNSHVVYIPKHGDVTRYEPKATIGRYLRDFGFYQHALQEAQGQKSAFYIQKISVST